MGVDVLLNELTDRYQKAIVENGGSLVELAPLLVATADRVRRNFAASAQPNRAQRRQIVDSFTLELLSSPYPIAGVATLASNVLHPTGRIKSEVERVCVLLGLHGEGSVFPEGLLRMYLSDSARAALTGGVQRALPAAVFPNPSLRGDPILRLVEREFPRLNAARAAAGMPVADERDVVQFIAWIVQRFLRNLSPADTIASFEKALPEINLALRRAQNTLELVIRQDIRSKINDATPDA